VTLASHIRTSLLPQPVAVVRIVREGADNSNRRYDAVDKIHLGSQWNRVTASRPSPNGFTAFVVESFPRAS